MKSVRRNIFSKEVIRICELLLACCYLLHLSPLPGVRPMLLSISNSDHNCRSTKEALRYAIILLLGGLFALIVAAEIGTRNLIYRLSANLARIHEEGRVAEQIHSEKGGFRKV